MIVGPFLGEVGFELLYWLPLVRRVLARYRIPPERVTVVSRGGGGLWYSDLGARQIDVYDLMSTVELAERLEERRAAAGDLKQLTVEPLDRELIARARHVVGPRAACLHPALMYTRFRPLYSGWTDQARFRHRASPALLPAPGPPPSGLPEQYVALKAYFSDCFPDVPANRAFLSDVVAKLAARGDVVLLTTQLRLDEHAEWHAPAGQRIHVLAGLEPRNNLAVQTCTIAGARALVSTYGGFSYLGSLLGVPTTAFFSDATFNPVHLAVLRESVGTTELVRSDEADAAARTAATP